MKKILLFSAITAMALSSCKKDSKPEKNDLDELFKLEYSNLPVEENKQNVEKAGIDFIQKINSLPEEQFIDVLDYLAQLEPKISSSSVSSVFAIGNAAKNKSVKGIFTATTSAAQETEKLSDLYRTYTWNFVTEEFDETSSNDRLEIKFPSHGGKTSNDAVLTFTYKASTVKATIEDETAELPASISAVLKVSSQELLKLSSSYEYKTNGTPTKVDINLVLGTFALKTKVSNTTSSLTSELSVLKGTEVLLSLNTAANGSLNIDNADGADDISSVVKNANATFEIMNIKLAGQVDFKALSDENNGFDNLSDSIRNVKQTASWNKHAQLAVINKDNNTIISKVEFIPVSDRDCYWWWNGSAEVQECYSYYSMNAKFVFKDGSSISEDNFDDSDFAQLIDELEKFADKFD